jgi:DNA-binding MarR family transcriptional regulator
MLSRVNPPSTRRPLNGGTIHELAAVLSNAVLAGIHEAGLAAVRPAHLPVLRALNRGPVRVTDLAGRARLTKASLIYLVNDLVRLGLVERTEDPSDGRATLVSLTTRGAEAPRGAARAVGALQEHWMRSVPREEIARCSAILEALLAVSGDWLEPPRFRGRNRPDQ